MLYPTNVRGRTRPFVLPRQVDDAGACWILFNIYDRASKVRSAQSAGVVSAFPKVAAPCCGSIDMLGITGVCLPDRVCQRIRLNGRDHQMDMRVHQAIGPDFKVRGPGAFSE